MITYEGKRGDVERTDGLEDTWRDIENIAGVLQNSIDFNRAVKLFVSTNRNGIVSRSDELSALPVVQENVGSPNLCARYS